MQQHQKKELKQLPVEPGVLFLGVSMTKIGNTQSAKKCLEYAEHLRKKINYTEGIGLTFFYGDYLYLHSTQPSKTLRDRYLALMISHKNAFLRLMRKDRKWTHKAFDFKTFGQLIVDNSGVFDAAYRKIAELYKKDSKFKKYVQEDITISGHKVGDGEVSFILEEIAMFYLAQKGELKVDNPFVTDHEAKWLLQCYPGSPLKSEVYLFQKNPLKLQNKKNKFENSYYDLETKSLYNYLMLDIDTLK